MDRREFLLKSTASAAVIRGRNLSPSFFDPSAGQLVTSAAPDVAGHTTVAEFDFNGARWKVYEDLRERDGRVTFVSGRSVRVLTKSAEPAFVDGDPPPHLGLKMDEIGLSGPDLLADKLLAGGNDPDMALVMQAAPPQGSRRPNRPPGAAAPPPRPRWDTFVGTVQAYDTQPVYPSGNTRSYHPNQYIPEINGTAIENRLDGLLGGWMPAVRKVMP